MPRRLGVLLARPALQLLRTRAAPDLAKGCPTVGAAAGAAPAGVCQVVVHEGASRSTAGVARHTGAPRRSGDLHPPPPTPLPPPWHRCPQVAKKQLRLTVETCAHYLTFSSEMIPDGATQYKCAPPLRGAENMARLTQAVINGGAPSGPPQCALWTLAPAAAAAAAYGLQWSGSCFLVVVLQGLGAWAVPGSWGRGMPNPGLSC
jgi:hypothetical protein